MNVTVAILSRLISFFFGNPNIVFGNVRNIGCILLQPSTFAVGDSTVPFLPNVLKVFLENGQTKSFKYDGTTTVRDVVTSLQQKLCLRATEHFALTVEHVKSLRRNKLTLLDPDEPLAKVSDLEIFLTGNAKVNQ